VDDAPLELLELRLAPLSASSRARQNAGSTLSPGSKRTEVGCGGESASGGADAVASTGSLDDGKSTAGRSEALREPARKYQDVRTSAATTTISATTIHVIGLRMR